MPILFSAVAEQRIVIEKFASCDGNFTEILEEVLSKVLRGGVLRGKHKMTYSHGRFLFHYIIEGHHFYFCLTDKACQRSRAFLFLNQIKRRFETNRKNFETILAEEMYRYSEDCSTITVRKGELDELNSIGVDSSEKILGEKILVVQNEHNLQYTKISRVGTKSPEPIIISVKYCRIKLIKIITAIIVIMFVVYNFSPLPVFLIGIIFYIFWSIVR